ncbi:uncharacterized protein (DUF58 family) [Xanthobacter sp. SG618]|uniref:DUF58 domain-containing protein n=1 Tax=Xanthobacter sp. SG618 TaxID=2587121 RepID=UPI00145F84AD|nr:DUF58 domain-containing protein [Xanthobacter sp. SG618]NMN58989.1 uncharacterized protein (DUF58 family) [Xanthobacter sp. SG618]
MVTAVLNVPGIRLVAAELLALRDTRLPRARHRPVTRRPGAVQARPAGSGMDLREIRAFAEGDDFRRIDPAATARTGTPHIRSFHEDRDDTMLLIADFRPAMLWGTGHSLRSVRGARALVRRGWEAAARHAVLAAISLDASGVAVAAVGAGVAQMGHISRMLADSHDRALATSQGMAESGSASLREVLARAVAMVPSGAEVLIATGPDGIRPGDDVVLARLARQRRVRVLLPLDPLDMAPPTVPLPIHAGPERRLARLCPFDFAPLAARMAGLNVSIEVLPDDAG